MLLTKCKVFSYIIHAIKIILVTVETRIKEPRVFLGSLDRF